MTEREMKSYEERLPLIDAAIEQGLKEEDGDAVFFGRHLRRFYFGFISRNSARADYICTRDEFEQRKAELQNKPKWEDAPEWANWLAQGVSGVWYWWSDKPVAKGSFWISDVGDDDHPDFKMDRASSKGEVIDNWKDTLEKRPEKTLEEIGITIEESRMNTDIWSEKPKEQNTNDWYEKGELPPVGSVVEAMTENKTWIECQVLHHRVNDIGMNVVACMNTRTHGLFWSADFKPLRTETDKLVESLTSVLNEIFSSARYLGEGNKLAARETIEFLDGYREAEGYRKIKPMSEQEFMKQCVDICGHGDARLYRAGCRFIEQVKV